jgi:hypothetical protein
MLFEAYFHEKLSVLPVEGKITTLSMSPWALGSVKAAQSASMKQPADDGEIMEDVLEATEWG